MLLPSDDCAKRRLTERAELTVAAEFLIARGFSDDEIAVQLSRFYYVDIDALNDVVSSMTEHGAKTPVETGRLTRPLTAMAAIPT